MRLSPIKLTLIGWLLLIVFSCITINIYFPEAAVQKTAEEIVKEVRESGKDDAKDKEKKKNFSSEILNLPHSFSLIPAAFAQEETSVSTPKIRVLKEALKERFPSLIPFYEAGNIGETNNGFIEIRGESDFSLKQKAVLRNLAKDENEDRKNLYDEVAQALSVDSSHIARVQKIFAENWIKNAKPGWWVQAENGEWIRKPS